MRNEQGRPISSITLSTNVLCANHYFRAVGKTDRNLSPCGVNFPKVRFLNKGTISLVFTTEVTSKTFSYALIHACIPAFTWLLFLPS